jgi:Tfp pilus assembly protein PilF
MMAWLESLPLWLLILAAFTIGASSYATASYFFEIRRQKIYQDKSLRLQARTANALENLADLTKVQFGFTDEIKVLSANAIDENPIP